MQSAYIGKLMELAQKDHNVLHILADSGTGYDELFRRNFPDQIWNFGISEENMVAAAAGMATAGKIPFVFTAGAFLAYRSLEFIRDDLCFQNLNVKVVGMGSGLSWSSLGPTHHTTEDLAVLRSLPNLLILSPATPRQVAESVALAYAHHGPVYIRIGMNHEEEFFPPEYRMELSRNDVLRRGGDVTLFTTGSILQEAVLAADLLARKGISLNLVSAATIKPFDEKSVLEFAAVSRRIFSLEEHNVIGGLGTILAEILARNGIGVPLTPLGLPDCFARGYGSYAAVRQANGLDGAQIAEKIEEILNHE